MIYFIYCQFFREGVFVGERLMFRNPDAQRSQEIVATDRPAQGLLKMFNADDFKWRIEERPVE